MEQAIKAGVLREYERDPTKLHCFRIHMLSAEAARKKNFSLRHPLMKLEAYARAMGYLVRRRPSLHSPWLPFLADRLAPALPPSRTAGALGQHVPGVARRPADQEGLGDV